MTDYVVTDRLLADGATVEEIVAYGKRRAKHVKGLYQKHQG